MTKEKPGPKSVKQRRAFEKRGTLGETSCESDTDDSSPENTLNNDSCHPADTSKSKITQRTQLGKLADNESGFLTPDLEKDVTDYGLEFTTSNIQNISPRRCSTLRTPASSQEEQSVGSSGSVNVNKENDTPISALAKSPQKSKPLKKATKKQIAKAKKIETLTSKEKQSSAGESPGKRHKELTRKPRKQRNPTQIERRFWKEVQVLQNRTDHLIPMLPFSRLVRELMQDASSDVTKITPTAMEALQTSSELYLTQRLQDAYMLTLHRGRVTLDVKDMELIHYLKVNL